MKPEAMDRITFRRPPAVERISRAADAFVKKIILVVGAAICLILFAQVISRYAGASLGWSEEVSRFLLVAITFLGSTAAYKEASFIGLKGIGQWLGPAAERTILFLLQMLMLSCFLTILGFGAVYTRKAWEHTAASIGLPMAFPYAVIPFAAAVLVVHVLADIARTFTRKAP